jgi:hypothetical protein
MRRQTRPGQRRFARAGVLRLLAVFFFRDFAIREFRRAVR